MINVILSSPNPNAFLDQVAAWPAAFKGIAGGVLGNEMAWRSFPGQNGPMPLPGSYAFIAPYRTKYRVADAVRNEAGTITTPAQYSPNTYYYFKFQSEQDWETLLGQANPQGIMPSGVKIEYASGLSVLGGTFGAVPANGFQHGWS